jgi:N-acetylmuramoyl-L-alanine amidase
MIKRTSFFLFTFLVCTVLSSFIERPKKQKVIQTIVIDPGHGGHDGGARGQYSSEKDICLDISLKVGALIEKEFPEVKVLYTRKTDIYPALHARADFANENKGDLFLCIHVNSAPSQRKSELIGHKTVTYYTGKGKNRKKKTKQVPQYRYYTVPSAAKGTETYIWGAGKTDDKELAVRENASMLTEANYKERYGDIDPSSPEFVAVSLLKTKQYFKRSATLAGYVQDEFVKVGRVDRDVKQRPVGIWVLQATAMPSVLVETGFISNPEEERYLNSEEGQNEISSCIVRALRKYSNWLEEKQEEEGKDDKDKDKTKTGTQPAAANTRSFLEMIDQHEKKVRGK